MDTEAPTSEAAGSAAPTSEAGASAPVAVDTGSVDVLSFEALTGELDRLAGVDPVLFADPDSVVAAQRMLAQAEALVTRITGAFDASGNWAPDGARTASAWLSVRCRIPEVRGPTPGAPGPGLARLPEVEQAWEQWRHLRCPCRGHGHPQLPRDRGGPGPGRGGPGGRRLHTALRPVLRVAAYWKQLADPEGADQEAEARRGPTRRLPGQELRRHLARGDDPRSDRRAPSSSEELERLEKALFEADWAEARAPSAVTRQPTELARTPGQRRADALVEMATRSRSCPGRRPPAGTAVHRPGRVRDTDHGGSVSWRTAPSSPRGPPALAGPRPTSSGRCSLPGAGSRSAPGPGCSPGPPAGPSRCGTGSAPTPTAMSPAPFCQVDHIIPWAVGGPTTQENGRLLCPAHNRKRTQRPPPAAVPGGS